MRTTIEESNNAALTRLAKQFNKDPETFAAEILRGGIQAIDDNTGNGTRCDLDPPYFSMCMARYDLIHTCTITGIIERMDAEELADAQKEADDSQRTLQEVIHDRFTMGVNMELLQ